MVLGNRKLCSLGYAKDVVMLADDWKGLNPMTTIFEEYLGAK